MAFVIIIAHLYSTSTRKLLRGVADQVTHDHDENLIAWSSIPGKTEAEKGQEAFSRGCIAVSSKVRATMFYCRSTGQSEYLLLQSEEIFGQQQMILRYTAT